jgi:hypothetical protein
MTHFGMGAYVTDLPPQTPPPSPQPPVDLAYQTPLPHDNAPTLVKLAGIFTLVSAGFDLVHAGIGIAVAVVMYYTFTHQPPAAPGAPAGLPFPPVVFAAIYGLPGLLSLAVLGFKIAGGIKLLRRSPRAWGWGLAAAIIGCTEVWMFSPCCLMPILPIGIGIFSIVVLCLPNVRLYLRLGPTDVLPQ